MLVLVLVSVFCYGTAAAAAAAATTYHPHHRYYYCSIGSGCGTCTLAGTATASTTNATIATIILAVSSHGVFLILIYSPFRYIRFVSSRAKLSHVQEKEQIALPALFSACRWLLRSMVPAPAPRTLCFYHVSWWHMTSQHVEMFQYWRALNFCFLGDYLPPYGFTLQSHNNTPES